LISKGKLPKNIFKVSPTIGTSLTILHTSRRPAARSTLVKKYRRTVHIMHPKPMPSNRRRAPPALTAP
jgi:hypothetical protein